MLFQQNIAQQIDVFLCHGSEKCVLSVFIYCFQDCFFIFVVNKQYEDDEAVYRNPDVSILYPSSGTFWLDFF